MTADFAFRRARDHKNWRRAHIAWPSLHKKSDNAVLPMVVHGLCIIDAAHVQTVVALRRLASRLCNTTYRARFTGMHLWNVAY